MVSLVLTWSWDSHCLWQFCVHSLPPKSLKLRGRWDIVAAEIVSSLLCFPSQSWRV